MTTLHENIKQKKQHIERLKEESNKIAIQRARVEAELEQHQKIEENYIRQMQALGYGSIHELEQAAVEKQEMLSNIVSKLDRMVAGEVEVEEVDGELLDLEEDDEFEF